MAAAAEATVRWERVAGEVLLLDDDDIQTLRHKYKIKNLCFFFNALDLTRLDDIQLPKSGLYYTLQDFLKYIIGLRPSEQELLQMSRDDYAAISIFEINNKYERAIQRRDNKKRKISSSTTTTNNANNAFSPIAVEVTANSDTNLENIIELSRISICQQSTNCECRLDLGVKDVLKVRYRTFCNQKEHIIACSEIIDLKFCIDESAEKEKDDTLLYLAILRVLKTTNNGLFDINDDNNQDALRRSEGNVVLELKSKQSLERLQSWMQESSVLVGRFFKEKANELLISRNICQENYAKTHFTFRNWN